MLIFLRDVKVEEKDFVLDLLLPLSKGQFSMYFASKSFQFISFYLFCLFYSHTYITGIILNV